IASALIGLGIYALVRARGYARRVAVICALLGLTSGGLMKALNWEGVYPTILSLGFGLLALSCYERWLQGEKRYLIYATLLLVPAYYSHPLGGILSVGSILIRGIAEALFREEFRTPRFLLQSMAPVVIGVAIVFPHYAAAVYYKRFLSELWLYPSGSVAGVLKDLAVGGKWSTGLLVTATGIVGVAYELRRRTGFGLFVLSWGVISIVVAFAFVLGYWKYLPLGKNMLAERYTTVLMPTLLAVAAAPVVRQLLRSVKAAWAAPLGVAGLLLSGSVGALTYVPPEPPHVSSSALKLWKWMGKSWPDDSYTARCDADPYTHLFDASVPISPMYSGHPTIMGWFSQGDPMFFSLAARWEWELGWVLDPNFLKTSLWATNTRYLLTKSSLLSRKLSREPGFVLRKRIGDYRVFEFLGHGGSACVIPHPIAVVDRRLGLKTENAYYTTLLNFVATPGNRYVFVDATFRDARKFDRVIVRPRTPSDVSQAVKLAREGRKVLLILPVSDARIARAVDEHLGVRVSPARPPSFVPIRKYLPSAYRVDGRWWKDVRVGRGLVRVCGVDVVHFTMRFHRLIKEVQTEGYRMPRLPTDKERKFVNGVLRGFDSGKPVRVHLEYHGDPSVIRVRGNGWVYLKVKYFPAWRSPDGPVYPASCGQMLVRVHGNTVLRYELPSFLSYGSYAVAAMGIVALGAMMVWM
ncbi:6-pyruvoyl-tetrahydropterin synthase-related protein, partial [Methanopyrus sp.]